MNPHPCAEEQDDLLPPRLTDLIDLRHEPAKLEKLIDWQFFDTEWAGFFPSTTGRPATSPRLVAGCFFCSAPTGCRTTLSSPAGSRPRTTSTSPVRFSSSTARRSIRRP